MTKIPDKQQTNIASSVVKAQGATLQIGSLTNSGAIVSFNFTGATANIIETTSAASDSKYKTYKAGLCDSGSVAVRCYYTNISDTAPFQTFLGRKENITITLPGSTTTDPTGIVSKSATFSFDAIITNANITVQKPLIMLDYTMKITGEITSV